MAKSKLRILVCGMIAGVPYQAGATWAVLQYVLGFRRLGHQVYFIETLDDTALRPTSSFARSSNAEYFCSVVSEFGLEASAALLHKETKETIGLPYSEVRRISQCADVLLDISGALAFEPLAENVPLRVYLDLDPAFTQLWHDIQQIDMRFEGHTHYITVGLAIGQPDCAVPTCGLDWTTTLQPIVLEHWPRVERAPSAPLTAVANWRGYGSIKHQGVLYGQKAHSWRRFMDVPKRTKERFLLALAIHPDEKPDMQAIEENGWALVDPLQVADTPSRYRKFIQNSKAELGIAKSGYIASGCGWFSDRSLCYLASGRPVIAQETGFSQFIPTGEGLFTFDTADDLVASIDELNCDYTLHSRAARALAEDYFDSDKVLSRMLQNVGATG
jgi:hypothetical protein